MSTPSTPGSPAAAPSCYRHPDRGTYVSCTRCRRYICPDCMRSAAVGHQCVECVNEGAKTVRQPRAVRGTLAIATYVLIAMNAAVFVLQTAVPAVRPDFVLWPQGIAVFDEFYRLLTSAFLHDGPTHLLANMFSLWVIGPALERWLGRTRFVALYVLSALGGSVLVYFLSPISTGTLGASGAIFGLLGATLVLARKLNFDMKWIVAMIAINLVITFTVPSISWQGHVGGLVTGTAIGYLYASGPRTNRALIQAGCSVALLLVFCALVWLRTAQITTGVA